MSVEHVVEVYRQRYETYRHLDKLHWQMLQILVAVGSASVVVLRSTESRPEWWFVGAIGLILVLIGFVMLRIGKGLRANGACLRAAGEIIGDQDIPDTSKKWKSSTYWTSLLVMISGLACVLISIWIYVEKCEGIKCTKSSSAIIMQTTRSIRIT